MSHPLTPGEKNFVATKPLCKGQIILAYHAGGVIQNVVERCTPGATHHHPAKRISPLQNLYVKAKSFWPITPEA